MQTQQLLPCLFEELKKTDGPVWDFETSCADVHWYVVQRLRHSFKESLQLTTAACRQHRVPVSYTVEDSHAYEAMRPKRFLRRGHPLRY